MHCLASTLLTQLALISFGKAKCTFSDPTSLATSMSCATDIYINQNLLSYNVGENAKIEYKKGAEEA